MYYLQLLWYWQSVFNSVIGGICIKKCCTSLLNHMHDTWLIDVKFLLHYSVVCCGLCLQDWSLTVDNEWEHMGVYGVDVLFNMAM
jgi:hypothetical protein